MAALRGTPPSKSIEAPGLSTTSYASPPGAPLPLSTIRSPRREEPDLSSPAESSGGKSSFSPLRGYRGMPQQEAGIISVSVDGLLVPHEEQLMPSSSEERRVDGEIVPASANAVVPSSNLSVSVGVDPRQSSKRKTPPKAKGTSKIHPGPPLANPKIVQTTPQSVETRNSVGAPGPSTTSYVPPPAPLPLSTNATRSRPEEQGLSSPAESQSSGGKSSLRVRKLLPGRSLLRSAVQKHPHSVGSWLRRLVGGASWGTRLVEASRGRGGLDTSILLECCRSAMGALGGRLPVGSVWTRVPKREWMGVVALCGGVHVV